MRRTWGVVLLVLGLAVTGCSASGDDDDSGDVASAGDESTEMTMAAEEGEALSPSDSDDGGGAAGGVAGGTDAAFASLPAGIGTKVVRTADLRIEVDKGQFAQQLRQASSLARMLGGFVQESSTRSFDEGEASGDVTIRVPVERFDDAMAQLAELGTVESVSEAGEDVTDQLVDLDARVRALRAEEDALNALMAEAANVNEVLSIRGTAIGIREQIEQLSAQQASLEDRSAYATIHVLLHEATAELATSAADHDDWSIARAFDTAVDAGEVVVGSLIVAVGVALPLLPFAAVALYVVRRRRTVVTEG